MVKENYILRYADFLERKSYAMLKTEHGCELLVSNKINFIPDDGFHKVQMYFKKKHSINVREILAADNPISSSIQNIAYFKNFDSFWSEFTKDSKWFEKYMYDLNRQNDNTLLFKIISESCNKLKRETQLNEREHAMLFESWEHKLDPTNLRNYCNYCKSEMRYAPRFCDEICDECIKLIIDVEGKALKLVDYSGSGKLQYVDGAEYNSKVCYIKDVKFELYNHNGPHILLFEP